MLTQEIRRRLSVAVDNQCTICGTIVKKFSHPSHRNKIEVEVTFPDYIYKCPDCNYSLCVGCKEYRWKEYHQCKTERSWNELKKETPTSIVE